LNENRIDNTFHFVYYENTETVEIESQMLIRNRYNSNISEEKILSYNYYLFYNFYLCIIIIINKCSFYHHHHIITSYTKYDDDV